MISNDLVNTMNMSSPGILIEDFIKKQHQIEEDLRQRIIELEDEVHRLKGTTNDIECRQNGKTTRLVDYYIQQLYKSPNKWISIKDHYPTIHADRLLLERIMKRMQNEHPSDPFTFDTYGCRIKLDIDETVTFKPAWWNLIDNMGNKL